MGQGGGASELQGFFVLGVHHSKKGFGHFTTSLHHQPSQPVHYNPMIQDADCSTGLHATLLGVEVQSSETSRVPTGMPQIHPCFHKFLLVQVSWVTFHFKVLPFIDLRTFTKLTNVELQKCGHERSGPILPGLLANPVRVGGSAHQRPGQSARCLSCNRPRTSQSQQAEVLLHSGTVNYLAGHGKVRSVHYGCPPLRKSSEGGQQG